MSVLHLVVKDGLVALLGMTLADVDERWHSRDGLFVAHLARGDVDALNHAARAPIRWRRESEASCCSSAGRVCEHGVTTEVGQKTPTARP